MANSHKSVNVFPDLFINSIQIQSRILKQQDLGSFVANAVMKSSQIINHRLFTSETCLFSHLQTSLCAACHQNRRDSSLSNFSLKNLTLSLNPAKIVSKTLKIFNFFLKFAEMAFHYNKPHPKYNCSAHLWLRSYAEIHPGWDHSEPLLTENTYTTRDRIASFLRDSRHVTKTA